MTSSNERDTWSKIQILCRYGWSHQNQIASSVWNYHLLRHFEHSHAQWVPLAEAWRLFREKEPLADMLILLEAACEGK